MIAPVMPTYARAPLAFERGEGSWLITAEGERYLDFGAGIAVNSLGHAHPKLVAALEDQARRLWHTSNLYEIPGQKRLAEKLVEATFADSVFFCNSGAEAMELCIKMARKYWSARAEPRYRIVTFEGSFHGRTIATISAAGNKKHTDGFGPLLDAFDILPVGDLDAVRAAVGPETAAIMIEPVQGEGGIRPVAPEFMQGLRKIADDNGILLIMDEIQTGVGRTGTLFAHEQAGVTPDIMGIAKGIGGGFPMGAVLATEAAATPLTAGTHGTTFGGNPLAMAVGSAVIDEVLSPGFLDDVKRKAGLLRQRLASVADSHPEVVAEVRGLGLMLGVRIRDGVALGDVVEAARERHLLTVPAGDNTMRILPPLTCTDDEIVEACSRLDDACAAVEAKSRMSPRHFLDLDRVAPEELRAILDDAARVKATRDGWPRLRPDDEQPLKDRIVALIFEKPSTRTRISFEVGIRQMGGQTIYLSGNEMQLGHGETVGDTARVLSRYVDAIMIRTFTPETLAEMAGNATVPVINGLTNESHPCQIMADVMTFEEKRGPIRGRRVTWCGDGNNVFASWAHAARAFDFSLVWSGPETLDPDPTRWSAPPATT